MQYTYYVYSRCVRSARMRCCYYTGFIVHLGVMNKTLLLDTKDRGADKSLARPTSRCILFDGENISFDARFVIYIHSFIQ